VGGRGEYSTGAAAHHGLRGRAQCAGCVDDVVDDDCGLVVDIADDVSDLGGVVPRAVLVEDR
jgi:hypothetical protein